MTAKEYIANNIFKGKISQNDIESAIKTDFKYHNGDLVYKVKYRTGGTTFPTIVQIPPDIAATFEKDSTRSYKVPAKPKLGRETTFQSDEEKAAEEKARMQELAGINKVEEAGKKYASYWVLGYGVDSDGNNPGLITGFKDKASAQKYAHDSNMSGDGIIYQVTNDIEQLQDYVETYGIDTDEHMYVSEDIDESLNTYKIPKDKPTPKTDEELKQIASEIMDEIRSYNILPSSTGPKLFDDNIKRVARAVKNSEWADQLTKEDKMKVAEMLLKMDYTEDEDGL